jgi:cellulose synthase/poly-beta-1,6-N-acetylglucosamine synthase-like glycosyltransferase
MDGTALPTSTQSWIVLWSRICLWVWITYFILLIPIAIISIVLYTDALYLAYLFAILLIFPIIGLFKPDGAKRSWYVKILLISLLFSILVNWTLIIGALIAQMFGHNIAMSATIE